MNVAVRSFKMLAAAVILTLGFTGCDGDNGTGSKPDNPDNPGGGGGSTFTDSRDGKSYKKVTIGTQVWMGQNLDRATTDSKCYENSAANCAKYGRLYTWSDATTACPSGWHLPSDAEWTTLVNYAGGESTAGKKLKSTSGWNENGNGTDAYGFSALPGGGGYSDDYFNDADYYGDWWSATESDASSAWFWSMKFSNENVYRLYNSKAVRFSVRCVQDGGTPPPTIQYTITFNPNGGTVSPTSAKTGDDGKLASLPTPTRSGFIFDGWYTAETGGTKVETGKVYSANTTIYARWEASGGNYTEKGNNISNYRTVTIGTQTWMAENLDYDVTGSVCYRNDPANCAKYGRLYTWSDAMTACPSGWHLPSDAEWTTLTDFVGGEDIAGTTLKSSIGWSSSSEAPAGTDNYGFSALPGAYGYSGGYFDDADNSGYWWSATEYDASGAWFRRMYYYNEYVLRDNYSKAFLFSVRCVQD